MDNTSEKIREMVFRWQSDIEADLYEKAGSEMVEIAFSEFSKIDNEISLIRDAIEDQTKSSIDESKRVSNR